LVTLANFIEITTFCQLFTQTFHKSAVIF
jgi:hypothetical protein